MNTAILKEYSPKARARLLDQNKQILEALNIDQSLSASYFQDHSVVALDDLRLPILDFISNKFQGDNEEFLEYISYT
ncbi:MAG: hypothetical protein R3Y52_03180, partial [Psittacicella sp.]